MTQPQQALAITEKNLTEAFEHARKLMNSKDANEVMQLQTEFLRNQFGIATEQSTQMDSGMLPLGLFQRGRRSLLRSRALVGALPMSFWGLTCPSPRQVISANAPG